MQNNDNPISILILLSTYNGEKFLSEQLDSICRQEMLNFHLLIRDDGSTDSTIKILNKYLKQNNNITVLFENNIGCALSFDRLTSYAKTNMPHFDYYAFCDQDDIWDDYKLYYAVSHLEQHKEYKLRLYTSAYRVVDEKLNYQYTQRYIYKHTLGEALIMINTMGCTQVFSKGLLDQVQKRINKKESHSAGMPNHDGWLYLVAITLNSYIYFDSEPHISYRQHINNKVGAYQSSFINRLKRTITRKNVRSNISKILFQVYNEDVDLHNSQLLFLNSTYINSFHTKLKLIFSKDMMTNSNSVNIAYRLLILFNYY